MTVKIMYKIIINNYCIERCINNRLIYLLILALDSKHWSADVPNGN